MNVHVVPWREATFDHGLLRVARQDPAALGRHVDILSHMLYHKLIGRPPPYVAELTAVRGRSCCPASR